MQFARCGYLLIYSIIVSSAALHELELYKIELSSSRKTGDLVMTQTSDSARLSTVDDFIQIKFDYLIIGTYSS
jgi:hypothetical protein